MKRKLFRLTLNRKLLLEDICTDVKLRLEHESGYALRTLEYCRDHGVGTKDWDAELKVQKELFGKLELYWDVLWVTLCHENPIFRRTHSEDCKWENEWDIPTETFNEAVDFAISLLQKDMEDVGNDHNQQIALLKELKSFRNAEQVA